MKEEIADLLKQRKNKKCSELLINTSYTFFSLKDKVKKELTYL